MPGYGKRIGPIVSTPEGQITELKRELAEIRKFYREHVGELCQRLFAKYQECPDKETRKLLIVHMGSKFFDLEAAQQYVQSDVCHCGAQKVVNANHCKSCGYVSC